MAAKQKNILVVTPRLVAAYTFHLITPDTKAPEGAAWKPDNKFKITGVADSVEAFAHLEKAIRTGAREKWPDVNFDDFKFPWTEHDDDARNEGFRGKVTITPKSQFKPVLLDSKRKELPKRTNAQGKEISPVFSGDIMKLAVTLYFYEKTEKVKEGKKLVDVTVRGCSLQLGAVQLLEQRGGEGGYANSFDDEDGFEGSSSDEPASSAPGPDSSAGDSGGDGEDF